MSTYSDHGHWSLQNADTAFAKIRECMNTWRSDDRVIARVYSFGIVRRGGGDGFKRGWRENHTNLIVSNQRVVFFTVDSGK